MVAVAAVLFALGAIAAALVMPAQLLVPYPAQRSERAGFARLERQARLAAIDRAARRYYLLEGRYPASLDDLVVQGLLASRQRTDSTGRPLVFEPAEDSYTLVAAGQKQDPERTQVTESVAGDVLLDRTLFSSVQDETGVPLVLLD
jgi:hypothetical protein